jgi:hypothetical protein
MKNLFIATLFVSFGIFAFWNDIPAYFESGKYLFQLPFVVVWNAKFEIICTLIVFSVGIFKLNKKN